MDNFNQNDQNFNIDDNNSFNGFDSVSQADNTVSGKHANLNNQNTGINNETKESEPSMTGGHVNLNQTQNVNNTPQADYSQPVANPNVPQGVPVQNPVPNIPQVPTSNAAYINNVQNTAIPNQAADNAKSQKGINKVTRTIGIIIGIILCAISIPVIIFNCFFIIQGFMNPDKAPSIAGKAPLIVLTDSMYPLIHGGDMIIIEEEKAQNIKANDVIAYFDPESSKENTVVTHRVKEVTQKNGEIAFKTRGDANSGDDKNLVPGSKLVGIYKGARFEGVGNFCMWLKSVPGIVVCVGIPLLILIAYDLIRRRLYARKQEKSESELKAELDSLRAMQAQGAIPGQYVPQGAYVPGQVPVAPGQAAQMPNQAPMQVPYNGAYPQQQDPVSPANAGYPQAVPGNDNAQQQVPNNQMPPQ